MGDRSNDDVEGQVESIPLYPQLADHQQQQQQILEQQIDLDDVDGTLTRADLDRCGELIGRV